MNGKQQLTYLDGCYHPMMWTPVPQLASTPKEGETSQKRDHLVRNLTLHYTVTQLESITRRSTTRNRFFGHGESFLKCSYESLSNLHNSNLIHFCLSMSVFSLLPEHYDTTSLDENNNYIVRYLDH